MLRMRWNDFNAEGQRSRGAEVLTGLTRLTGLGNGY